MTTMQQNQQMATLTSDWYMIKKAICFFKPLIVLFFFLAGAASLMQQFILTLTNINLYMCLHYPEHKVIG